MKKVNLSLLDRSSALNMLPSTGSVDEIKQIKGFIEELGLTDAEREVEMSFNDMHDKSARDEALNSWYKETKEMEISDELYSTMHDLTVSKNQAKAVGLNESLNLYEQFMSNEE